MMNASISAERIEVTLGELVELITQIAMEVGDDEREGYELASLALLSILRHNPKGINALMH